MADMHVVFKHGVKEIAQQHGKTVTFMPKYSAQDAGKLRDARIGPDAPLEPDAPRTPDASLMPDAKPDGPPESAVKVLDQWVAQHPDDQRMRAARDVYAESLQILH